jgi:hypothetical protein
MTIPHNPFSIKGILNLAQNMLSLSEHLSSSRVLVGFMLRNICVLDQHSSWFRAIEYLPLLLMLRALHLIPSHRVFAFTLTAACITENQQILISYLRFDLWTRSWRYHSSNEKRKSKNRQWPKIKRTKGQKLFTKHYTENEILRNMNPTKTRDELGCSERLSIFCARLRIPLIEKGLWGMVITRTTLSRETFYS